MIDLDRNLQLDADGDLTLVTGTQALAQRIENRLGTQQGEWFYDLRHGVPWLFQILGEAGDSAAIRQLLVQQIAIDTEVASIGEFNVAFNANTRKLSYAIPVQATDGSSTTVAS